MLELSPDLAAKRDRLLELLAECGSCAVAFSGGVDSAVVAKAARLALADRVVLVTGTSAALADGELEAARELASLIGVRHVEIATEEFENPNYVANAPDRCYHCKSELYSQLDRLAERAGMKVVVNGANADDLGDYRPGMNLSQPLLVRRSTSLNLWNGDRRCVRSSVPRGDSLVVDGYFWNSLRYAS